MSHDDRGARIYVTHWQFDAMDAQVPGADLNGDSVAREHFQR